MLKIGVQQKKNELLYPVLDASLKACSHTAQLSLRTDADIVVFTENAFCNKCSAKTLILPNSKCVDTTASQIITYGLCCKNTLTVSSCIGSNMIFSLQRMITTASGVRIDVQDFPVSLSDPDEPELVLATVATLLAADVPVSQISTLDF